MKGIDDHGYRHGRPVARHPLRWNGVVTYLLLLCCGQWALADEPSDDVRSFPAAYFFQAQPQTALDMIRLLPGFSFDPGDPDVRGYSGSAGNVLIDGQRLAGKFDSLDSALQRIPSSVVERIELISGSTSGIDMQGQLLVANVIRRATAANTLRADTGLYLHADEDRHVLPDARFEVSRRDNGRRIDASVHVYRIADDDSGDGYRQRMTNEGELTRRALSELFVANQGMEAAIGYERPVAGGGLRLHTVLRHDEKKEDEDLKVTVPAAGQVQLTERKKRKDAELGVNFDRSVGDSSTLELILIQQLHREEKVESEFDSDANVVYRENSDAGESIARAAVRNSLAGSAVLEWGAEFSWNFLDSLFLSEVNGMPADVPESDVRVEEYRGEAFASVSWDLSAMLSAELGSAFEYSRIRQSSETTTSRWLSYLKPRALLTWVPSDVDQLRLRLQRNVGQLDFDDFVSSAELSTGTLNIGNPDLEPGTEWAITADWERQIWQKATVVLGVRHAWLDNVVDVIPIVVDTDGDGVDEVFEGPGNLGPGNVNEYSLGLNLPLSGIGISGGVLKGVLSWRRTSVHDPETGERRPISGVEQPWTGQLEFTQDLPERRLRWGAHVELAEREPEYRIDEIRDERKGLWVGAFVNFFAAPAWTLSLELENLSGREQRLTRTLYDAPRAAGTVAGTDVEQRRFDPYIFLKLSWSTG